MFKFENHDKWQQKLFLVNSKKWTVFKKKHLRKKYFNRKKINLNSVDLNYTKAVKKITSSYKKTLTLKLSQTTKQLIKKKLKKKKNQEKISKFSKKMKNFK